MDREMDRITPLDEMDDFKVADGDPYVRGWEVHSSDGRKIGEVDNLLVDRAARKVRYLDVDLDDSILSGEDRHILVPIGYARLDESDDQVHVEPLAASGFTDIPAYQHTNLTRDYEASLHGYFGREFTHPKADTDFYDHESYDDSRFFGSRRNPPTPMI